MGKKDVTILALAICAALLLTLTQFTGNIIQTGAWGLCWKNA